MGHDTALAKFKHACNVHLSSRRRDPDWKPYLSVCLIARNCEKTLPGWLEHCFESILARAPGAEIVVVDTLSTDSGIDVKVRPQPGLDTAGARAALERAGFKIVFCEALADLHRHYNIGLATPRFDENENRLWIRVDARVLPAHVDRTMASDHIARLIGDGSPHETHGGDGTAEIAKRYADVYVEYKGPNGDWTYDMEWFDDAANARQLSFELASGHWRLWVDADDELPDPETAKRLLRANGRLAPPRPVAEKREGEPEIATLEDLLRWIERTDPTVTCLWAPYLYQMDPSGVAIKWQERERIVKWSSNWRWAEQAHEVLVPIEPHKVGVQVPLAQFLFVHRKRFTAEDGLYAVRRHWDVLLKKYEAGNRTTRTCRYLASYASMMDPRRHEEFVREAHAVAITPVERYQALIEAGRLYASRGYYHEALEHFGAATALLPDLPDAWMYGAHCADKADDLVRAAAWFKRATECTPNFVDSNLNPREFQLSLPIFLARTLQKLAKLRVNAGLHVEAEVDLHTAWELCKRVAQDPLVGDDAREAKFMAARAKNAYEAQKTARAIYEQWDFLRRNDETAKAAKLLRSVPHMLQDHPLIIGIEQWARALRRHLSDPGAYNEFYKSLETSTDSIPTDRFDPSWLTPEGCLPRARFLIDWIKANRGAAPTKVLEVGSYDGIIGVPVLAACSNVSYAAIDAQQVALDRFQGYAKQNVPDGDARLTRICRAFNAKWELLRSDVAEVDKYDVVVCYELIEHVPDPELLISALSRFVKPDGRIFLSTPWGSYDNGSPDDAATRDPRGHVRAMTARDAFDDATRAGCTTEDLFCHHMAHEMGNNLVAILRPQRHKSTPLAFAVSSALWDWNSRHVHETGIGASEETIVYLAKRLAGDSGRRVEVYGPVPEPEVHHGVAYWPHEQLRKLPKDAKVVVSRRPAYGAHIDAVAGRKVDKILWLQDAYYADLNPETAAQYESIVVLTEWHKRAMHEIHGVPLDKMVIINNFLLREHFDLPKVQRPTRLPHHFVYASSPDRGLDKLLKLWPRILAHYPDATLSIFYGWEGCMKLAHADAAWVKRYREVRGVYDALRWQSGIIEVGRVNHARLAWEFMRASAWLYPCVEFFETGCLTAMKTRAAGCVPVTTPRGALAETAKSNWTQFVNEHDPDFDDRYIEAVCRAVETPEAEREKMAREAIENHCLEVEAAKWRKLLE